MLGVQWYLYLPNTSYWHLRTCVLLRDGIAVVPGQHQHYGLNAPAFVGEDQGRTDNPCTQSKVASCFPSC